MDQRFQPTPADKQPSHPPALSGVTVLDMSALGPGPFCSMLLADHGADVISVARPNTAADDPSTLFARGKRSIIVDLRAPGGATVIRRLAERVDVLLEGNRPGVMERRGLGPDTLLAENPRLIYTRLTGYGQTGPYAQRAGHDINYLALAGGLSVVGIDEPVLPLNLLGDFAGGSLFAAMRIMLALLERERTGHGQVIDAAIVDGTALLLTGVLGEHAVGRWPGRGQHLLCGVAPFYSTYRCSDDRWFSVGALERPFYDEMLAALGLASEPLPDRNDREQWPILRARFAAAFAAKPRNYWEGRFAEHDGCGAPVLDIDELESEPHLAERAVFPRRLDLPGGEVLQAQASQGAEPARSGSAALGRHTRAVLSEFGFRADEVAALCADGVVSERH